jgi:ATP-dependent DNA helicase RecG
MQELKSAKQEFEEAVALYPELAGKVWLMHGKMKPLEKQEVMDKFKKWDYMVLVSTTVIEVWIDVPEATIMVIKNADRFGLAQLHQLRGRVWRSDIQSYCFLETKHKAWDSYQRLRAMEQFTDGFKLAELDLKYRGAWEFLGTRQSGITDIPYEMMSDTKFLEMIQQTAISLLEKYPWLEWLDVLQGQIKQVEGELLV